MVHGRAREPPRQTWLGAVDEGKVRVSSTEITGQVRVRAMQAGQTRSCGVRAHTHKHPRTEMPAVGSHATCAAALPSGYPPDPSSLCQRSFGQLKIVNRPTPQTSALFSGPHGLSALRVFGDLMSNISATRGRPDMRFCVCGSPSEDLSHIASLTIGCSR